MINIGVKICWIFVPGYFLFLEAHSFPRATCSWETILCIMAVDKYLIIFSHEIHTLVYILYGEKIMKKKRGHQVYRIV